MSTTTETRMNRAALVAAVAAETGIKAAQVDQIITATLDAITRTVTGGTPVMISNFGTWMPKKMPPRMARNPQTGDRFPLAGRQVVRFKVSPRLRTTVQAADPVAATARKRPKSR
ncbi:HU family DNA-binding protein [Streptomyces triculaminicus]|uniref:HU family DNA-binding protein n=1 Tax=Streptomyces triculaminicus TaxID=2816232 RepID=UPI00340B2045